MSFVIEWARLAGAIQEQLQYVAYLVLKDNSQSLAVAAHALVDHRGCLGCDAHWVPGISNELDCLALFLDFKARRRPAPRTEEEDDPGGGEQWGCYDLAILVYYGHDGKFVFARVDLALDFEHKIAEEFFAPDA